VPFTLEPGEAAFYGPKIDFVVQDVIGREWQLGTVQVDYQLPQRFDLTYAGPDNKPHRPVMIHRAPFGSMERFVGVLIEHFAGAFPLLALARAGGGAADLGPPRSLRAPGPSAPARCRASAPNWTTAEKVNYKIREAQLGKDPVHAGDGRPRGRAGGRGGAQPQARRPGREAAGRIHRRNRER
jgi:threonyl-tRNA synthetase